jgi:hypothetical protein
MMEVHGDERAQGNFQGKPQNYIGHKAPFQHEQSSARKERPANLSGFARRLLDAATEYHTPLRDHNLWI